MLRLSAASDDAKLTPEQQESSADPQAKNEGSYGRLCLPSRHRDSPELPAPPMKHLVSKYHSLEQVSICDSRCLEIERERILHPQAVDDRPMTQWRPTWKYCVMG